MAELPEHLARLSPQERRAALKQLLEQKAQEPREHPLSAGQRTLWFLHHIGADRGAQNLPVPLHLLSPLHESTLRQALGDLIERHPVLRTTYHLQSGEPVQRVHPHAEPALEVVNATDCGESELLTRVGDYGYQEFNLESGPVFRATLVDKSDREQILLLAWHHIALDGWSLAIMLWELNYLYELRLRGLEPDLPLPPPYSEFVTWQQQQLATEQWEKDAGYWRSVLSRDVPRLRLPADHIPPVSDSERAGAIAFLINEGLRSKLQGIADDAETTLFTVLLAGCQVLLWRYSGQEHVSVRVPTNGRPSHHFQGTCGYFVNQVVLQGEVLGEMTFRELLSQAQQRVLDVIERGDYPLSLLLENLPPGLEPGFSRFTGAMFILQKLRGARRKSSPEDLSQEVSPLQHEKAEHTFGGVRAKAFPLEPRVSGFELDFQLLDLATKIVGVVNYRRSMFERVTVERLARHLQTILERICENPRALVSDIAALPDEQEKLLDLWNQTDKSYPETSIAALFEEQARKTPDAIAIEAKERQLSYRDLDDLSDRLAERIRGLAQAGPSRVAIFLPRSADAIVAMLSACKSGVAFVPVDPSLPDLEVNRMLEETTPVAVLTTSEFRDKLPPTDAAIVSTDDDSFQHAPEISRATTNTDADSPLYVLYTSGSTGPPQGVMGTEAATVNRLHWMWEQYPYEHDEVACLTAGPGFVDSIASTLGPLLRGVRVVVADQETLLDPDLFSNYLARHGVTRLTVVPSLLRLLLDRDQPLGVRLPTLRYCLCGGESMSVSLARDFLKEAPQATLLNIYGCSEAAGDSTCYEMREGCNLERIPIGRPIANTKIHILDKAGRRLPIGVAGEITIAGKGLARGYWGRAAFFEEPFVITPGEPEMPIYRTGDRGRYLYDGSIEYLGRLDRQLQIRGHRVEPGEVEDVLASHPGVEQACVTTWAGNDEEGRLIAYVVAHAEATVTAQELRGHATVRLADAKVPSAYIFLDALPLSVNGKLDIGKLPDPAEALARQSEAASPRDPVEEVIAAVWSDVLGISEVGIHDHFFELGGHSILATRAVSRLREILRAEIPLRLFFIHPTVAGLSSALLETPEGERISQVAAAVVEVSSLSEEEVSTRLEEPRRHVTT